jgi:hypothetical protein
MRGRPFGIICFAALITFSITNKAVADIKLRIKYVEGQHTREITHYFKATRQRDEFKQTGKDGKPVFFARIYQCDLRQMVNVDYTQKYFFVSSFLNGLPIGAAMAFNESQLPPQPQPLSATRPGGNVSETITVTDTGERKEMYGFTARHIRTTITWDANPSCNQTRLRQEIDGWYADLLYGMECSPDISGFYNQTYLVPYSKCAERFDKRRYAYARKQSGAARMGFPLVQTRKVYDDKGRALVSTQEVIEVSRDELESQLFEIPANYARLEPEQKPYKRSLLDRALSIFGWR